MLPVSGLFLLFPPQLEVGTLYYLRGFVWECWLLAWCFSCELTHNPWQHACIHFHKSALAACRRYRNSKAKVCEKFTLACVIFSPAPSCEKWIFGCVCSTGSEYDEEEADYDESDSDESWTTESAISSESILSSMCMNGGDEKPFACPVPGCKKRYKVRNRIQICFLRCTGCTGVDLGCVSGAQPG